MPAITSAGIGSGLDIEGIITGLMNAEKIPLNDLKTERNTIKSKISMYGQMTGAFDALKTAASLISKLTGLNPQKVSSSDEKIISASASETATAGQYSISVSQLAKQQSIAVAGETSVDNVVGTGSLTITLGSYTSTPGSFTANASKTPVTINIDPTNQTLGGIKDAINNAKAGVNATIVNDGTGNRLVLTSKDTGDNFGFKIEVTDSDGVNTDGSGLSKLAYNPTVTPVASNNMKELESAKDALFKVNNLDIKKSSNTVSDAISGVTLNLKALTTSNITIDIAKDDESLKKNLQGFVDAYNKIRGILKDQQTKGSTLGKDTSPAQLERGLRNVMRQISASGYSMSDVGMSIDKTGTLTFDQSKLNKTLATDPQVLEKFFADTTVGGVVTSKGMATQMADWITGLNADGGLLESRTEGLNKRVTTLDKKEESLNLRLDQIEKRYRAQFSSLDAMLSSMQSTSSYLSQQLSALQNM